jgi:hypothetical protein
MAYCIALALSDGESLNINKPEEFSDGWELGSHRKMYARNFFRSKFMEIREKLKEHRFPVRGVIYGKSR